MPSDVSPDRELQLFDEDVVHQPRLARRTLSQWAGLVWYENSYRERYGVPGTESAEGALARERLLMVVRARLPHLDSNTGNGRSCDCRYLRLALGAFDRERLATIRQRYLTASAVAVNGLLAFSVLVLALWYLHDASALTSDRAFGFLAGISGGLVVATIQMVIAITTLLTDRVAETVEWRWFHPDGDWRLVGALSPRQRRNMRHAHLRRAADAVLRPVEHKPASRPSKRSFAVRLRQAYRGFKLGA